jgi:hypothetical protein
MFAPAERWGSIHRELVGDVPQPARVAEETPEVIDEYVARIRCCLNALATSLQSQHPDAVIIVGDDQHEVFSEALVPALAVFVGASVVGTTALRMLGERLDEGKFDIRCHADLALRLAHGLTDRGFDIAILRELHPMGRPEGGIGHAFSWPVRSLGIDESAIPIVPIFLSTNEFPRLSAQRCLELGRAIAAVAAVQPERIAILASGGLSHDPHGPRAGWINERLDRWVLDRIAAGDPSSLAHLFTFDSDGLDGGTGEIRAWITVAGAMDGVRATVLDYIPAAQAVTGLAFAHWSTTGE